MNMLFSRHDSFRLEHAVPTWKRILLRSAGFGAGFAVIVCAVIGGAIWYSERPKPPKPWNKQAITAEYDYVFPEGEQNNLVFRYVLQNNTDSDYRVKSNTGIDITGKLKQQNGFSNFDRFESVEYPVFVPAKSRVRVSINMPYSYPTKEKANATGTETKEFRAAVEKFVTKEMPNLGGFVLFDTLNRYEIDFPNGWEQRAKETATK
jgi:hypothetical protein